MKETIVKEFFWLIIGSLVSLILSFVFLGLLDLTSAAEEMNEVEKVFSIRLCILACFCHQSESVAPAALLLASAPGAGEASGFGRYRNGRSWLLGTHRSPNSGAPSAAGVLTVGMLQPPLHTPAVVNTPAGAWSFSRHDHQSWAKGSR